MTSEREIAGRLYICPKLPAEQGLELLLLVSSAFAPVPGLLEAVALNSDDPALVYEFFDMVRDLDPAAVQALILKLSSIPKPKDEHAPGRALEMENLAELALFAIGAQFRSFFARTPPGSAPRLPRDPDAVTLTSGEVTTLGPNITPLAYLLRPTALHTSEPMCTLTELRTTLTIDDLANMHEAMDLREYLVAKAAAARPKGGRHGRH